jgi:hypothetical protein
VTAQTGLARLDGPVVRAILVALALCIGAIGATITVSTTADAARPRLVRDHCTETSGGGEGMECNSADDILIRTKNADGTCGAWICCPPNDDGSYNCDQGSSAGGSQLSTRVGGIIGQRATTLATPTQTQPAGTTGAPAQTSTTSAAPAEPQTTATPANRRRLVRKRD